MTGTDIVREKICTRSSHWFVPVAPRGAEGVIPQPDA